jgi:methyl-accepting chemotaxis protein
MLDKMKLGKKISLGYAVILVLLFIIVIISIVAMNMTKSNIVNNKERTEKSKIANDMIDAQNDIAIGIRNMILSDNQEFIKKHETEITQDRKTFTDNFEKLEKTVVSVKGKELMATIKEQNEKVKPLNNKALERALAGNKQEATAAILAADPLHDKLRKVISDLIDYQDSLVDEGNKSTEKATTFSLSLITILGILSLVCGIFISIKLTKSITAPINRVVEGLADGAEQVAAASSQVASASQYLAEGTSEQASSLEETSSSLEELSSMTKQNADNANQAKVMMMEIQQTVEKVNDHMEGMSQAINEITKSSEQTGKIIKTIDEIAFQTNLLALNAAVEAARAGEAGAGFAVVADEVRNLAMRAAEAAKNTNSLIENTVKTVHNGAALTLSTQEAFKENMAMSTKIAQLIDEIATASGEQSHGISQINTAVAEMDKVVQQSAANAEESASASEEMNAQAEQMKVYVHDLLAIVSGGNGNGSSAHLTLAVDKRVSSVPAMTKKPGTSKKASSAFATGAGKKERNFNAAKVIPFDDSNGSFNDF